MAVFLEGEVINPFMPPFGKFLPLYKISGATLDQMGSDSHGQGDD